MQSSDNKFFEEYKRLDKLCSDMYSCRNGVSEYIAQMESNAHRGQYRVSSWDSDYKKLKHIRWVRNRIAHDSDAYRISEPEDLTFVRDFYDRIISGRDPLTLLRKAEKSEADRQRQQRKRQASRTQKVRASHKKKSSRGWNTAFVAAVMLILIFILFYFIH